MLQHIQQLKYLAKKKNSAIFYQINAAAAASQSN